MRGLSVVLLHVGELDGGHELREDVGTRLEVLPRRHVDMGVEHRSVEIGVGLQLHVAAADGHEDREQRQGTDDMAEHNFANLKIIPGFGHSRRSA